jgi:hypothetical protein
MAVGVDQHRLLPFVDPGLLDAFEDAFAAALGVVVEIGQAITQFIRSTKFTRVGSTSGCASESWMAIS